MNSPTSSICFSNIKDLSDLLKTATSEKGFVSFSHLQDVLANLDPAIQDEILKDSNIIADTLWAADVPAESVKLIEAALRDMISTIVTKEIKPLDSDESNI